MRQTSPKKVTPETPKGVVRIECVFVEWLLVASYLSTSFSSVRRVTEVVRCMHRSSDRLWRGYQQRQPPRSPYPQSPRKKSKLGTNAKSRELLRTMERHALVPRKPCTRSLSCETALVVGDGVDSVAKIRPGGLFHFVQDHRGSSSGEYNGNCEKVEII